MAGVYPLKAWSATTSRTSRTAQAVGVTVAEIWGLRGQRRGRGLPRTRAWHGIRRRAEPH